MSDISLTYDHVSKNIGVIVNGNELENVAAVNVAVSKLGSACTVVFECGTVNVTALIDQLVLGEEPRGGN
jgi:hypothetical protein